MDPYVAGPIALGLVLLIALVLRPAADTPRVHRGRHGMWPLPLPDGQERPTQPPPKPWGGGATVFTPPAQAPPEPQPFVAVNTKRPDDQTITGVLVRTTRLAGGQPDAIVLEAAQLQRQGAPATPIEGQCVIPWDSISWWQQTSPPAFGSPPADTAPADGA